MYSNVDDVLQQAIYDGLFPGCALSIRHNDEEVYLRAFGDAEIIPTQRAATEQTVWDLASLTKVLCTAHLYLRWVNAKVLDVDTPLQAQLPHAPKGITIADCLSHSSGYDNWRPFYSKHISVKDSWGSGAIRDRVLDSAVRSRPTAMRRSLYQYSDIGYIALCAFAEARFGKPIHLLWQEYLPEEAKRGLYWGHPEAAATEDCPVRGRVIIGEVHDLNAAAMGGKAGHAGLFGSVSSVSSAAQWSLNGYHGRTPSLSGKTVRYFWNYRGSGSHCLGWDTPSPTGSSASDIWPANGVGHLGFTGTSLWIAPDDNLIVAFASNRVHPVVEEGSFPGRPAHPRTVAFRSFRPKLHQLIYKQTSG